MLRLLVVTRHLQHPFLSSHLGFLSDRRVCSVYFDDIVVVVVVVVVVVTSWIITLMVLERDVLVGSVAFFSIQLFRHSPLVRI